MTMNRALRIIIPACVGAGLSILAFREPFRNAGGHLFEYLREKRAAAVTSRNILLLEIDGAALHEGGGLPWSGSSLAESLLLMTEMDADRVVFDRSVDRDVFRGTSDEAALRASFDREFSTIKNNIRTLFDAIRLGSVRAKDSAAFVGELSVLIDAGKGRLLDAAVNGERKDADRLEQAFRIFGRAYRPDAAIPDSDFAGLTFDRLGLPPDQSPLARAVFSAALDEIGEPAIEIVPGKLIFRGAALPGLPVGDVELPVDDSGAILLDYPLKAADTPFIRASFESLLRHQRLEGELYAELKEMERTGYLNDAAKTLSPVSVYEYAANRRMELLSAGSKGAGEWRDLRQKFFDSADRFLNGTAEQKIISGYDALLASASVPEDGKESVRALKSAAANSFSRARATFRELMDLRGSLRNQVGGSFCIVALTAGREPSGYAASAALADAVFTGRTLRRVPGVNAFAIAAASSVGLAVALSFLSPVPALAVGAFASAAAALIAAFIFIASGPWLNPLLPALSVFSAAAASALFPAVPALRRRLLLRRIFGSGLARRAGAHLDPAAVRPLLSGGRLDATILVVRAKGLSEYPSETDPRKIASAYRIFRESVSQSLKDWGAYVYAQDGELVFAAFGEPFLTGSHCSAARSAALAVAAAGESLSARLAEAGVPFDVGKIIIGIDSGLCDFGAAGGVDGAVLVPFGAMPVRARLLSSLGERYGHSVLAAEGTVRGLPESCSVRRLDRLVAKVDGREEWFYGLDEGTSGTAV